MIPLPPMARLLGIAAGVYGAFLILAIAFQRRLTYIPHRAREADLVAQAARAGLAPWRDALGRIVGWRSAKPRRPGGAVGRAVVFHGNGGSASQRDYFSRGLEGLDDGRAWEVYLFEYPGYGARPGPPGESEILSAARAALAELAEADDRPLFLVGESLGSGVATRLAAEAPDEVAGLLLVTPFTRLADVASHHYRIVPVRLFLRERYDCVASLAGYRGPVAFVMAGRDEIVPVRLTRQLHGGYAGPKRLWIQEKATHTTVDFDPAAPLWREISDFLMGAGLRRNFRAAPPARPLSRPPAR